ncbi:MAG TPA: DJ-1/PfpI family protein [Ramlibacter sp.]
MNPVERRTAKQDVAARHVVIVVFDGAEALDIAGPASVFANAEQLHRGSYTLHVASARGGHVVTNAGLVIHGCESFAELPSRIDTLVVAGGDEAPLREALRDGRICEWLAAAATGARRVASVCSGAFALAAAGLLDGRKATTHWAALDQLQRVRPRIDVQRDRIYVRDGRIWTSAGVVTSIELALALVEDDLGHQAAMAIARTLALPMLRGGEQPQLSQALQAQETASRRIREVVAWIGTHLGEDLSVAALAEKARMSQRHFARAFAAETGCTPARHVQQVRLAAATELLLRTQWTQQRIAERSGYGSVDALQRAFLRHHQATPRSYRDRYAARSRAS